MKTTAFFFSLLMTMLASGVVSGQQKPITGYAPVNGLKMYYEIHGKGDPVVLIHGSFMTITNNWTAPWGNGAVNWIAELSKTRIVIAVECRATGARAISTAISAMRTSPKTWRLYSIISTFQKRTLSVTPWAAASLCVCDPPSGKSA